MKVAIYARISKRNSSQDADNQIGILQEFASRMKYEIHGEYVDELSGAADNRPEFQKLFEDAGKRKFDMVLFWSLDRFSREGARKTIHWLERLESYGVSFRSFQEQFIDSSGIFKDVIISLLATLAKQEKVRISERVKVGLERAASKGRKGGRPRLPKAKQQRIKDLHKEGLSNRKIAQKLGITHRTVQFYIKPTYSNLLDTDSKNKKK